MNQQNARHVRAFLFGLVVRPEYVHRSRCANAAAKVIFFKPASY
jgi:hypothetical protein